MNKKRHIRIRYSPLAESKFPAQKTERREGNELGTAGRENGTLLIEDR